MRRPCTNSTTVARDIVISFTDWGSTTNGAALPSRSAKVRGGLVRVTRQGSVQPGNSLPCTPLHLQQNLSLCVPCPLLTYPWWASGRVWGGFDRRGRGQEADERVFRPLTVSEGYGSGSLRFRGAVYVCVGGWGQRCLEVSEVRRANAFARRRRDEALRQSM